MTPPQVAILVIVAATLALLAYGRWRHDVVAALALVAAVLAGVVPAARATDGFGNPVVATVGLLLVMAAAIRGSGVIDAITAPVVPFLRWTTTRVVVLGALAALASAFANNAAVLSAMLPAVSQASRRHRAPPAPVLLPVALLSVLGGLTTLVGTVPNLLVSDLRRRIAGEGFGMFDFVPAGVPLAALGLLALSIAWRLVVPRRAASAGPQELVPAEALQVEGYTSEILVPHGSPVAGQTVRQFEARGEGAVKIQAIIREAYRRVAPRAGWTIEPDDVLVLACEPDTLQRLMERSGLQIVGGHGGDVDPERVGVLEAVVTPASELVGRSPDESGLDQRFRISLLAIGRSGGQPSIRLRRMKLRAGDVLVLQGELASLPSTLAGLGCLPLAERRLRLGRRRQVLAPVALLGVALGLAAQGLLPLVPSLLCAVLLMVLFRVMTLNELYDAVPWPVIVTAGALLPVGDAFAATGAASLVADWCYGGLAGLPDAAGVWLVLGVTLAMASLSTGIAAVLVMAPVAVALAVRTGVGLDPLLMAVAVGGSCEVVALIGQQSTRDALAAGGVRRRDGRLLGSLIGVLVTLVGPLAILLAWPLRP